MRTLRVFVLLLALTGTACQQAGDHSDRVTSLFAHLDEGIQPGAAVMVISNGKVVYSKGFGYADIGKKVRIDENSTFRLGSVSKQFTATAIMLLAESGKLDYNDPIVDYLPQLTRYPGVTIRHLLAHTSGLPDYYDLLGALPGMPSNAELAGFLAEMDGPDFAPGERHEYSNSAYEMLSLIVEKASDMTFSDFMEEHVFRPAGMDNSLIHDHTEPQIPNRVFGYDQTETGYALNDYDPLNGIVGSGSMYATLDDFYAWDSALYGEDVVKQSSLKHAFTRGTLNNGDQFDYGLGWRLDQHRGHRRIAHNGSWVGFRTGTARYPDEKLTIVVLTNRSEADPGAYIDTITDIYLPERGNEFRPSERPTADETEEFDIRVEKSVMAPMRDGVLLSTDLYFPDGATGKLPAILIRTIYSKSRQFHEDPLMVALVQGGYVVAIQDERGRYESEGRYTYAVGRREDSYDAVTWLTEQPWSNQKVGTAGCSYEGENQVVLAAARHPNHLVAMPMSGSTGYYTPGRALGAYDGGVFELAQTAGWFAGSGTQVFYGPPAWVDRQEWFRSEAAKLFRVSPEIDFGKYLKLITTLPTVDILQRAGLPPADYEDYATSLPDSEFLRSRDWYRSPEEIDVPALFMDSWYDYGPAESLELFNLFQENGTTERAKNNQFIIIGPTGHCGYPYATEQTTVGERDLGDARLDFLDIQLRWYNYWMKGIDNGITDMPKVQYYLMGKNEWRNADSWPPAGTKYRKWYLRSDGKANSRNGDGMLSFDAPVDEPSDRFTYDPGNPVPSLGGHTCCTGTDTEAGGYDQSGIEERDDVLVYTSPALEKGIEVTGRLEVVLHIASSATDTDFTAKLVDVYPDGRAFNVQEGALRLRYREGLSKKVLMHPGKIYEIRLDLHATSNYFAPGHRLRLEVSSSNFPRWDRNLNTGGNNYDETEWKVAENTVFHSIDRPSYIVLPVIE